METVFDLRFIIIALLGLLVFVLFEFEIFKTKVASLMLAAKQLAKDKVLATGKEQEDFVVIKILSYLPAWIREAIPEDVLRKLIKYLYNRAMDYIDDGKFNESWWNDNANT